MWVCPSENNRRHDQCDRTGWIIVRLDVEEMRKWGVLSSLDRLRSTNDLILYILKTPSFFSSRFPSFFFRIVC